MRNRDGGLLQLETARQGTNFRLQSKPFDFSSNTSKEQIVKNCECLSLQLTKKIDLQALFEWMYSFLDIIFSSFHCRLYMYSHISHSLSLRMRCQILYRERQWTPKKTMHHISSHPPARNRLAGQIFFSLALLQGVWTGASLKLSI